MKCDFHIRCKSKIYIAAAADTLTQVLPAGRVVVISDANVDRLHCDLLSSFETILIGSGETVKTLTTVESVVRRLVELGADRSTFILGIGGGIVTDVTGFVASTYMRGVRFGFVSTTLMGQVDAAVGGKNGVNVDGFKNMVGTFTQPEFVICDPAMLRSLPDREFRAGLAEVVKAGVIADEGLFALVEKSGYAALRADSDRMTEVVRRAIAVKAAIVERDECESGERRKLNLGHTFAHAIEKSSNKMNHGEAVAVGLTVIARIAVRMGQFSEADCLRLGTLLGDLGFTLTPPVEVRRLLRAIAKDKKAEQGSIHLVIPHRIGACEVRELPLSELERLVIE